MGLVLDKSREGQVQKEEPGAQGSRAWGGQGGLGVEPDAQQ